MGDVARRPLVLTKEAATVPRKPKLNDQIRDAELVLVVTDRGYRVIKDREGLERNLSAGQAKLLLGRYSN